jgi:hypothetical protein
MVIEMANLTPHARMNLIAAHEKMAKIKSQLNKLTKIRKQNVVLSPRAKERRERHINAHIERLALRHYLLKSRLRKTNYKNLLRSEAKWRAIAHFIRPRLERTRYTTGLKRQQALAKSNFLEFTKKRENAPSERKSPSPKRKSPSPSPRRSGISPRSPGTLARERNLGIVGGAARAPGPPMSFVTWTRLPTGKINIHK